MRTLFRWMLLAPLAALFAAVPDRPATAEAGPPQVGQAAPDFSAVDSKGKSVTLSEFRGRTVVLEWTNADCPYVRKHYGSGNMQTELTVERGGEFVLTFLPGLLDGQHIVRGSHNVGDAFEKAGEFMAVKMRSLSSNIT